MLEAVKPGALTKFGGGWVKAGEENCSTWKELFAQNPSGGGTVRSENYQREYGWSNEMKERHLIHD